MSIFAAIAVLFLSYHSRTSGSAPECQTVEIHPGQNVTLWCVNQAKDDTYMGWFRVTNRTKASCVSSMFGPRGEASFCQGFDKDKYEMSANTSQIFLHVKHVDFSDTGLYFCGFYLNEHMVISETTYVNIPVNSDSAHIGTKDESGGLEILIHAVLGGLSGVLAIVVIALAVKIRKLQTAVNGKLQQERNKNQKPEVSYAPIKFDANPKKKQRPASGRPIEPSVVYATTRNSTGTSA